MCRRTPLSSVGQGMTLFPERNLSTIKGVTYVGWGLAEPQCRRQGEATGKGISVRLCLALSEEIKDPWVPGTENGAAPAGRQFCAPAGHSISSAGNEQNLDAIGTVEGQGCTQASCLALSGAAKVVGGVQSGHALSTETAPRADGLNLSSSWSLHTSFSA